jgi:hypothetical protein
MEEPARINGPTDLKKLVDEKGKEWLAAAMVEGKEIGREYKCSSAGVRQIQRG